MLATAAAAALLAACGGGSADEEPDAAAPATGEASGEAACEVDGKSYPSDDIRLIVPYAAGGGTDLLARAVANGLGEELGVQVNVVNLSEGSGVVGMTELKNSEPDGSTIGSTTNQDVMMYHRTGLGDVTVDDLEPFAVVSTVPAAVTVKNDAPYASIEDLLAFAKENPGELVGSGTGAGGIWDLGRAGMLLAADLDLEAIRWVPSQGAAPTLQEILAGGVDISFASLPENAAMIEEGRVKALAVMADERQPGFPDVPTLKEEGVDFSLGAWRGYGVAAGTPQCIIDTLSEATQSVVESPEFIEFMKNSKMAITHKDAEESAAYWEEQDAAIDKLITDMGIGK